MEKIHDIGVVVARFQVDDLHPGQVMLLDKVQEECHVMMVFLGVPPTKSCRENPLPFQARKLMVEEKYPNVRVLYAMDVKENEDWSRSLDEQISIHTGPGQDIMLYGSRDSFIAKYDGRYATTSVDDDGFKIYSGTAVRHQASIEIENNRSWRKGCIWSTQNTYQSVWPTVDIAIFNEDGTKILLGRKPRETKLRFPGGFVDRFLDAGHHLNALEVNARREAREECGENLELSPLQYVGSCQIEDWRYGASSRIITTFFKAKVQFGRPQAGDDLEYLEWVTFDKIVLENVITDAHQPLVHLLWEDHKRASAT